MYTNNSNHVFDKLDWLTKFDLRNWELRQAVKKNESDYKYKIELFNSRIEIHNYDLRDCPQLERRLTAYDMNGKISWRNFVHDSDKKTLIISGGINVSILLSWFHLDINEICESSQETNEYSNIEINLNTSPKNSIQEEAIDFLLSSGHYKVLNNTHQRILALKTGEGKTYCTIAAISKIKWKSCIIIHNEGLMKQWIKSWKLFTDIKEEEIYIIKGHDSIESLLSLPQDIINSYKIFLASHRTLSNLANTEPDKLSNLFKVMKVGIKVFDEGHKEQRAVNLIDFYTDVKETWYLTATPGRSDYQEQEIFKFCYATTPRYGEEMRYDNPYHNVWLINYNSYPTPKEKKSMITFRGFNYPKYTDYCFDTKWDILSVPFFTILDKIVKKKGKIAILIPKNNIIEIMADIIKEHFNDAYGVGTYCTIIPNKEEREKELDNKIILSTEKSLGTGMDIKGLKFLMLFVPVRSDVIVEQILGRLREIPGENVFFIDFCDYGFDAIVAQRKKRLKLYEKKAKSIKTIEFRD